MTTAGLRTTRNLAWLAVLLVAASSPARSQHPSESGAPPPAESGPRSDGVDWNDAVVVEIELHEFHYAPRRLTLQLGKPHIVRLRNVGTIAHDMGGGSFFDAVQVKMTQTSVGRTLTPMLRSVYLRPRQQMEIWLVPMRSGVFGFFCGIAGHREGGMEGEVEVR